MKKQHFIACITVLGILTGGLYMFALWKLSTGFVDQYYPKFTGKAGSLILGASRAQEGLVPSIIEEAFTDIDKPVLNFAFKLAQSSYGPEYFRAVRAKLDSSKHSGLFILSVSPASVAVPDMLENTADANLDAQSILSRITDFNSDPNFRYIRKFYARSLYNCFLPDPQKYESHYTHDDGWLEFSPERHQGRINDEKLKEFKEKLINSYRTHVTQYKPSKVRVEYLKKTIEFLKQHGQVILVRMPADPDIRVFEDIVQSDFEEMMSEIAKELDVNYYSYLKDDGKYHTYDGSHLSSEGAKKFTKELCAQIRKHRP